MTQALAVKTTEAPLTFTMTPRTLEEALKYAELMSESDLVPSGYKGKPGNILVAIQKGLEVGLTPMAALETIAVINGRASLWGDGMLALVQAHPAYEGIDEGESSEKEGICTVKRKGESPYTVRFSLEDAKRAGLLGKSGPWTQYTKRMLQLRARGFALRDKFADALKGMIAAEEALDTVAIEAMVQETPAPTLKEKLKAQIEHVGGAIDNGTTVQSAQADSGLPPTQSDREADATTVFQDHCNQIRLAQSVSAVSHTVNTALDDPLMTPANKAEFRKLRDERMTALQPASKGRR